MTFLFFSTFMNIYQKINFFLNKPLIQERPQWILWLPVAMGCGIGFYFSLPFEPELLYPLLIFVPSFIFWVFFYKRLRSYPLPFLALSFIVWSSLGFNLISLKTHLLATPFLEKNIGPIGVEGKIERIEYPPSSIRLILKDLKFDQDYPYKAEKKISIFPKKIRLTLRPSQIQQPLQPGDSIRLKVKLHPLPWPALPGGYDFRRKSYYEEIGATGYVTSPPVLLKQSSSFSFFTWIQTLRHNLTAHLIEKLSSPTGPIAAALITGDRSGIPQAISDAYANAGIAHILAISGLHLSLVAAFVFLLSRRLLCLFPRIVLSYPIKKWASVCAFFVILGYLGLSGAGYPVERAFIMTSLVLAAILLDRIALTIRSIALAATCILFVFPESLVSASFCLSFAAVTALITAYEAWGEQHLSQTLEPRFPYLKRLFNYILGILFSTLIATLATTPYTIFFFHKFTLQGFIANLLSIPLTGFWILPWGFIGVLLMPLHLGFEGWPFYLMGQGITLMTDIALWVNAWPGARLQVPLLPPLFIGLITFGGLWLCLWKTFWRFAGLFPIIGAFSLIFFTPSPTVLISSMADLIGVKEGHSLYVSSLRKNKFTRARWEEALAVPASQKWPQDTTQSYLIFSTKEKGSIVFFPKKSELTPLPKDPSIIIFQDVFPSNFSCPSQALCLDWFDFWRNGSYAFYWDKQTSHWIIKKAKDFMGDHPWVKK